MKLSNVVVVGVLLGSIVLGGLSGALVSRKLEQSSGGKTQGVSSVESDSSSEYSNDSSDSKAAPASEESLTVETVKRASPAVVSIVITKDFVTRRQMMDGSPFDDFFNFSFPFGTSPFPVTPTPRSDVQNPPQPQRQEIGGGTGFLISSDGLILTNKHVVSDEEAQYTVITNDGKEHAATVVGRDPTNDLAVVKIEGHEYATLTLGDSNGLVIGQTVIAIGNSLSQYRNTVTKGVVSGIGRRVVAGDATGSSEVIEEAIQTDAAINPGNSGGPLLDLKGHVIGINSAVNQGGQLIGFAIPSNTAQPVVESVKKNGRIVRPWLGVRYVILNARIAKENNFPVSKGALVLRGEQRTDVPVIPGSPADKAGVQENDIIVSVNGTSIDDNHTLAREVQKYQPGDTIELKVLRKGSDKILKVKLEEFKQ